MAQGTLVPDYKRDHRQRRISTHTRRVRITRQHNCLSRAKWLLAGNVHSRPQPTGRRLASFRLCPRCASGAPSSWAAPECCRTCGPSAPDRGPSPRRRRPTRPPCRPRVARTVSDSDERGGVAWANGCRYVTYVLRVWFAAGCFWHGWFGWL